MPDSIEILPTLQPGGKAYSGRPVTVFRADYAPSGHLAVHRHARGQLAYAASGVMTVTTEGTASRQGGAWVVPPTQALWIPPRLPHAIRMTGAVAMRTLYLRCDVARCMPASPRVLAVSALLRELILRVMETPDNRHHYSHLTALIIDELRAAPSLKLQLPMPRDERLLRICRILLSEPGDTRALPELARIAGASTRSLARLFQAELGMSFTAWRQQARLMEALRRLADDTPVTMLALDLGYATPSAFTYMFRRALGFSPSRLKRTS
jgi:AraC-like DNA-binding protein